MEQFQRQVEEAAEFIRSSIVSQPRVALILGTGLGGVTEAVEEQVFLPYESIPGFPVSTVQSHLGNLICARCGEKSILIMQGRFHLYEGYTPHQISFPIRVMTSLGIRTLVVCSAAGGLNPLFRAGDLMLVTDHINLTGHNPLVGPNVDKWGPRFPDMAGPYNRELQDLAVQTALSEKIPLRRGVYVGVLGPSLETAAETRFLRTIGGDAVGMSMIMEVITGVHAGLRTLGISVITNVNLPDHYLPASVEEIIATAERAVPDLRQLIRKVLERIPLGASDE